MEDELFEKSKSKSQQRLMGAVYAYLKGDLDLNDVPASFAEKIKSIADGKRKKSGDKRKFTKGMSVDDAKDFASTKHKKLPEKVEEEKIITKFEDFINEEIHFEDDGLEIDKDIFDEIKDLTVDCPECKNMDDDGYQCGTCGGEGADGKINVLEWILDNIKYIKK